MKKSEKINGRQWIIKNGKGQFAKVVILSIFCMISAALGVYFALLLKNVVDYAVKGEKTEFIQVAVVTSILILFQILVGYLIRYLDERSRADLENTLKKNVWGKIMTRDYLSIESYHTGELMNRLSNDVKVVADNIVTLIPSLISMLTKLVCAVVILLLLDWRFTAIFLAGGMLVMGFSFLFRKKLKRFHKDMQEAEGKVRSFQQEMLESLLVIRSFQAEEKMASMGSEYMEVHKKMRLKRNVFNNISQTGFSVIMNAGYLFGIFWCGFGILQGTITYGTLLAVQQLIGQVQQPIANIAGFIPRYYAMVASAERLYELEKLPEDDVECDYEDTVTSMNEIVVEHITTGYNRDGEDILKDTGITIHRGDIMAVTGESGAGKSTFVKMLLSIYPLRSGTIHVESEDGVSQILNKHMRNLFAYVPQGNFLISGTIRDVVSLYGMKGAMTVEEACKIACANEYIENLPDKYDTRLLERGSGVSEGQMQRLAIARALYIGADVLLLDEATSALDSNTEVKVLENIKKLKNKTVIIVTHRPAALDICNRVIRIKDGKIIC